MRGLPLLLLISVGVFVLAACSTTAGLRDDQQLYTGMLSTKYNNYEKNDHFLNVQEELDLVLASKPNGALFGSPSIRSPFPIGLWIWNAFAKDTTSFSRWLVKAFGSTPVTISAVTPNLRVQVGENLLKKRGYFNGKVYYEPVPQRNPKKVKLKYTVDMGHLWTLDSFRYVNFPNYMDTLIVASKPLAEINIGDPFDVATLEKERQRLTTLFKDNGYYYYQNNDASYLADTTAIHGKARMRLQLADSVGEQALRQWYIGNITVNLRNDFFEELTQQHKSRRFTINYNGKRPKLRTRVLNNELKIKKGSLYSYEQYQKSRQNLNSTGIFQATNFTFTPTDSTDTCKVLDLKIDAVFDKPYDFSVEAYGKGKTNQRYGPELVLGLTKRNAFRGGELLNINLHGSYEWSSARSNGGSTFSLSNYEYGVETSLQFPRILNPFRMPKKWRRAHRAKQVAKALAKGETYRPKPRPTFFSTPTTLLKAAFNILNRAEYFRRHVVSGEFTYQWQPNERNMFSLSPLILTYEYMNTTTPTYDELADKQPYLKVSMADQFIPKMQFQYTYMSPSTYQNPIKWWTTVSEASNILSLGYLAAGKKWNEKDKQLFKNPYAQFFKVETNFTKTWALAKKSTIAAHVNAGVIWTYGNSMAAPYTEQFYVGGANSVRAFNVREIGPGKYRSAERAYSYVEQTGDIKLQANVEYRPHLFGSLYGAVFLDAGNVWLMHNDEDRPNGQFKFRNMLTQVALGTGVGLRYDLGYFMIRLDWGFGLHVPYNTGKSGFYNVSSFRDAQALHLAIGLPF